MRLDFEGKQHVYGHHLTVPISPLVVDKSKSLQPQGVELDADNLIIQGDNLYALKALMPKYVGNIQCIYIDPPYNTGNEDWIYNDNVNSPLQRQWLATQAPVDGEDLERHDKWMCMMWPRLHLLRELLSEDGVIFVSIDSNEQHHLRMMMDEIFGEDNFVNNFVWVNNLKGRQISGYGAAGTHEYILVYAKEVSQLAQFRNSVNLLKSMMPTIYRNVRYDVHSDELGDYVVKNELHNTNSKFNEVTRPNLVFDIYYNSKTQEVRCEDVSEQHLHLGFAKIPPKLNNSDRARFHAWRWSRSKVIRDSHDLHFAIDSNENIRVYTKVRSYDDTAFKDIITDINTTVGKKDLEALLGNNQFEFPKPVNLIKLLVSLCNDDAVVLDSFAGSGTTAQSVVELNKEDGGNRKFILVELEDYVDRITAERIRRLMKGTPGSFSYCTLGSPVSISDLLRGTSLPSYADMAASIYYNATGEALDTSSIGHFDDRPFHRSVKRDYWMLYRPDLDWLRSGNSALTMATAERIHNNERPAVVFASHKYLSQKHLSEMNITFCQIPYPTAKVNQSGT